MRQSGRYLPSYQELRQSHSLIELFTSTKLIVEVTTLPLTRFPSLDALILFSDITLIVLAFSAKLSFQEGPQIDWPTFCPSFDPAPLRPVLDAIAILKQTSLRPLLGFCGAPFTVASYIFGGLEPTLTWMRQNPEAFKVLLDQIQKGSLWYLKAQEKEGVDAIQIFDSWAHHLSISEWQDYSLRYVEELSRAVTVPTLFFMRKLSQYLPWMGSLSHMALSLGEEVPLSQIRKQTKQSLQGNLSPTLLLSPLGQIRQETESLLLSMEDDPAFILNLGHGVLPKTPPAAIEQVLDVVGQRFS
jgi:uroporphyrinogen decarboxylase